MRPFVPTWGHTSRGCVRPVHSQAEWNRLRITCGCRCFYCGKHLIDEPGTKDHLVPICRGGCDCIGNIVEACLRCNSMKMNKTVSEFLHMKPALVESTGKFYTAIVGLKPLVDAAHDPLLREVKRMARSKSFPDGNFASSYAWRNPA